MRLSLQTSNYVDFKNLIASLPTKGTVYYNGTFSAVFVSNKRNYSIAFGASSVPSSFATDFPSAVSGVGAVITPSEGISLAVSTYSDFMAAINSTPINRKGNIYYFDDTPSPDNFFSAMFVSTEGDVLVSFQTGGITSPPATFASDWPTAIALTDGSAINGFTYQ
jgi:hypothetical protein